MYEYRISVALNGKFFFRTEWDPIKGRVYDGAIDLIKRYGGDCVTVSRRNLVIETAQGYTDIKKMLVP